MEELTEERILLDHILEELSWEYNYYLNTPDEDNQIKRRKIGNDIKILMRIENKLSEYMLEQLTPKNKEEV